MALNPIKFTGFGDIHGPNLAVLKAKTILFLKIAPGFGPESAPNLRLPQGNGSLDLPPGGAKNNMKNVLKHSQVMGTTYERIFDFRSGALEPISRANCR
jgi:hypothetical protein